MDNVVDSWIRLQSLPQESDESESLMWAAEEANLMSITSPDECWEFIVEVIDKADDEWILTNIAAGPLENLLSTYPDKAIALIE